MLLSIRTRRGGPKKSAPFNPENLPDEPKKCPVINDSPMELTLAMDIVRRRREYQAAWAKNKRAMMKGRKK
jgi:hypothetical protein